MLELDDMKDMFIEDMLFMISGSSSAGVPGAEESGV